MEWWPGWLSREARLGQVFVSNAPWLGEPINGWIHGCRTSEPKTLAGTSDEKGATWKRVGSCWVARLGNLPWDYLRIHLRVALRWRAGPTCPICFIFDQYCGPSPLTVRNDRAVPICSPACLPSKTRDRFQPWEHAGKRGQCDWKTGVPATIVKNIFQILFEKQTSERQLVAWAFDLARLLHFGSVCCYQGVFQDGLEGCKVCSWQHLPGHPKDLRWFSGLTVLCACFWIFFAQGVLPRWTARTDFAGWVKLAQSWATW